MWENEENLAIFTVCLAAFGTKNVHSGVLSVCGAFSNVFLLTKEKVSKIAENEMYVFGINFLCAKIP